MAPLLKQRIGLGHRKHIGSGSVPVPIHRLFPTVHYIMKSSIVLLMVRGREIIRAKGILLMP